MRRWVTLWLSNQIWLILPYPFYPKIPIWCRWIKLSAFTRPSSQSNICCTCLFTSISFMEGVFSRSRLRHLNKKSSVSSRLSARLYRVLILLWAGTSNFTRDINRGNLFLKSRWRWWCWLGVRKISLRWPAISPLTFSMIESISVNKNFCIKYKEDLWIQFSPFFHCSSGQSLPSFKKNNFFIISTVGLRPQPLTFTLTRWLNCSTNVPSTEMKDVTAKNASVFVVTAKVLN